MHSQPPKLATGQQPAIWPFPPLDAIQARNHAKCVEAVRRLEQQRRQQRLREVMEALGEGLV